jgi:hypothetical protein
MADLFSIRRNLDAESGDLADDLKAKRQAVLDAERERIKRLVRLKVGYYFDPQTREILRKVGSQFVFVRHDRRRTTRDGGPAETVKLKPIQGGLFWDAAAMAIYQFRTGHYVLYSRDRRKVPGKSPVGKDRRKAK